MKNRRQKERKGDRRKGRRMEGGKDEQTIEGREERREKIKMSKSL